MKPTDARRHGREWALSIARAEQSGDLATAEVYRSRMVAQMDGLAGELRDDLIGAFEQWYDAYCGETEPPQ